MSCRGSTFMALAVAAVLPVLTACDREARQLQPDPAPMQGRNGPSPGPFRPGPVSDMPPVDPGSLIVAGKPPEGNAFEVSQGKRLYRWFNCNVCHGGGGGGNFGPALSDAHWRYGGQPNDIVSSILQGRPNGMPSFAGRVTPDQALQLAAYVRSLGGHLRSDVAPSRSDTISTGRPEQRRDTVPPRQDKP